MIDPAFEQYLDDHTSDEDFLMYEVNRRTHLTTYYPRMLSGKVQGKFLEFISRMMKPKRILEIGTFTGYSALALAKGLTKEGKLITIEINEELENTLHKHFSQSEQAQQIELIIGNALEIIPGLTPEFDLIFVDGDKEQYPDYYRLAIEKLKPGGFMLIDNVLWSGKVVNAEASSEKETAGIVALNTMVTDDPRVEQVMLSIRDGILMVRKNESL
jgi:predicted O-methyltransferase YrrM